MEQLLEYLLYFSFNFPRVLACPILKSILYFGGKTSFGARDCFLPCAGLVENLRQVAVVKKWVKERKKKQLSAWSIMNINNFEGKVKIYCLCIMYVYVCILTSRTWVTAHWNPSFLVNFSWISCLKNWSKVTSQYLLFSICLNLPKMRKTGLWSLS